MKTTRLMPFLLLITISAVALALSCRPQRFAPKYINVDSVGDAETDCMVSDKNPEILANRGTVTWVSKLHRNTIQIDFAGNNPWQAHNEKFDVSAGGNSDSSGTAARKGTYPYKIHINPGSPNQVDCRDPNVIVK